MEVPISYGDYRSRSGAANSSRMVNMFVELDETKGGTRVFSLMRTPGLSEFVDLGRASEGRGGYSLPSLTLCVLGREVYSIDHATQVATLLGEVFTTTGAIQWAENPSQVMLTDGGYGYIYLKDTGALINIIDADFPSPLACTFKDGYGVVVESSTGRFFVSDLNDFTSWDALSYTTAEYEADNLISCLSSHDSLFAFGVNTTQTYYNSGNVSFPFDNRQGAAMQIGCGATNSPAKGENIVFWLDNRGLVRKLDGHSQQIISSRQIEHKISQFSTFADARGHVYTQEGHTFYVLIFPTDGKVLVYDMASDQWHERSSYPKDSIWRGYWVSQHGSLVLVGDRSNGKVYKLDPNVYTDNLKTIKWNFTLQNVNSERFRIQHSLLELHIESGVGIASGQGADPKLWMIYSDDDGQTWTREKWRSVGKIGEYKKRVKFYALGTSRSRIYSFFGTDPVKMHIVSARLEGKQLGY